jgi:2-methylisocitrate lyase-like PEP mutase family enzyme
MSRPDLRERRAAFRALHERGCFALPNPWDVGTARYLEGLGFRALATTSAGFAFSLGRPDGEDAVPRELVLRHVAEIAEATDLPVNADFASGYGATAADVEESVRRCVAAGASGLSIEDAAVNGSERLHPLSFAVERVLAARKAIDASASGVVLTARAECHLVGHPDPLPESIRRLQAYAEAGADVLYAPGLPDRDAVKAVVEALRPRPVNVLATARLGLGMDDLAALGVRRVSVGSGFARAAWSGFIGAARALAERGSFQELGGLVSHAELDRLFAGERPEAVP